MNFTRPNAAEGQVFHPRHPASRYPYEGQMAVSRSTALCAPLSDGEDRLRATDRHSLEYAWFFSRKPDEANYPLLHLDYAAASMFNRTKSNEACDQEN
jgi:hypothetical protein